MKKLIIFFYLFIVSNFVYAFEQNSFYQEGEFNIYTLSVSGSTDAPPPPPPPDFGGGSTTPGGPDVIIGMYLPLLFAVGVFLIYRAKMKSN